MAVLRGRRRAWGITRRDADAQIGERLHSCVTGGDNSVRNGLDLVVSPRTVPSQLRTVSQPVRGTMHPRNTVQVAHSTQRTVAARTHAAQINQHTAPRTPTQHSTGSAQHAAHSSRTQLRSADQPTHGTPRTHAAPQRSG